MVLKKFITMKQKLIYLFIFFSTYSCVYGQTSIVGSDVGIPTMDLAVSTNRITINNNGVIDQNIVILGDFVIDGYAVTFDDISILTVQQNCDELTILNSQIEMINGTRLEICELLLEDSNLTLTDSKISEGFEITLIAPSASTFLQLFDNSEISDISTINVGTGCFFIMDHSILDNAPVNATTGNTAVIIRDSEIKNASGAWAFFVGGVGSYSGSDNVFTNNQHAVEVIGNQGFYRFKDENSTYNNHNATALNIRSAAIVEIDGITIDNTTQNGIRINNSGSVHIQDGDFTNIKDASIELANTTGAEIIDIRVPDHSRNPSSAISPKAVISVASVGDCLLSDILISNLDPDMNNGILVKGTALTATGCDVSGGVCGINVQSSICDMTDNKFSNATGSAMFFNSIPEFTLCSNLAWSSPIGINFSGVGNGDFINNNMYNNSKGLVYQQDALVNEQKEHGNDFYDNGFGAELLNTDRFVIDFSQYIVRDNSEEFPSHTPDDWFKNIGTSSDNCNVGGGGNGNGDPVTDDDPILPTCEPHPCPPPPPICTYYIEEVDQFEEGYEMIHLQNILSFIEKDPSLLSYPKIDAFCDQYCGTALDQLPTMHELLGVIKSDAVSYPVMPIDYNNSEAMSSYYNQCNTLHQNSKNNRDTDILNLYNSTSSINTENPYELDYKNTSLLLLQSYLDSPISLNDEIYTINIASSCVEDKGPAVYLARILCISQNLIFNIAECNAIHYRSSAINTESEIKISPSPVNNFLNLDFTKDPNTIYKYSIINLNGQSISHGALKNNRINVSTLESGTYILKINNDHVKKFIKI